MVRQQLFGAEPVWYAGFTAWRAVTSKPAGVELLAGEWWGCGQEFGIVPLSGERIYWFATRNVPEGEEDMPSGRKQALLKLFQGWYPAIPALIRATREDAMLRNDIYDRSLLNAWSKGRVTLLGDAAHPMTTKPGSGSLPGIEDAVVLAASLRASGDIRQALQTYQATRLPRATLVMTRSHQLGALVKHVSLPINLPMSALRFVCPCIAVSALGARFGADTYSLGSRLSRKSHCPRSCMKLKR